MIEIWQNLPSITPSEFFIFGFSIKFYSLAYILGVICIILFIHFAKYKKWVKSSVEDLENIVFISFLMAILGGRIFYILFYNLDYYLTNPVEMFWPFRDGKFVGFYGLSFHGGFVFSLISVLYYAKKKQIDFEEIQIALIPPICLALMFGRLGNFFNGELFGRETTLGVGMYFDSVLRHPSQLYQAFYEGPIMFCLIMLSFVKFKIKNLLLVFVALYSVGRFMIEFFREPDSQLGLFFGVFSMGQLLSIAMLGVVFFINWLLKQNKAS